MSKLELKSALVKKGKKRIMSLVFSRIGVIALMLLIQLLVLLTTLYYFEDFFPHFWVIGNLISVSAVFYLINCQMNTNSKITWLVLIMITPVFGSLLFIYTKSDFGHRALKKRVNSLTRQNKNKIPQSPVALSRLKSKDGGIASLAEYITRTGCHPVYDKTRVVYLPTGEEKFRALLTELEKAERFIFIEYFIIDEGRMWGEVLEILERKARMGVEVRVIYDGTCEFTTLPHNYPAQLRKKGIHCKIFSPITPFISTHYNFRDHRKIVVIDGKVAFNGGINLADEYINEKVKYGHWKDTAVMLVGDAVESFTLMFLQMWGIEDKKQAYNGYLLTAEHKERGEGFVIPFADCPVDDYKTGERVYMDILNRATHYVHIMTPYLILDAELEAALKFTAERGVDVSIILPGIPDKKGAWALAKTHYRSLINSGVKIYEYTPGFIHAKVFVADSREAVVGTINLDYRSLYHHFECATYFAYSPSVEDVEKDFSRTLDKCRRVTHKTIKKEKLVIKIRGMILKIIAPLM